MGKKLKKVALWVRRRSYLPVIIIGSLVVLLLYVNDETSIKDNAAYQARINELQREIKLNEDSAAYYRSRRHALESGASDLEAVAREQFHMQRPTEDVYLIK